MVMTTPPILRAAVAASVILLSVFVVLLVLPRQASAAPYSSYISLAKATAAHHPASAGHGASSVLDTTILIENDVVIEGGRTDASTTSAEQLDREEEQREMLRRAILLVKPYHSGDGSSGVGQAVADQPTNETLVAPIVIRDVHPPSGPVSGGTAVQVTAGAYPLGPFVGRRLSCRFTAKDSGGSNASASWLVEAIIRSQTIVECPTPSVHRPLVTKLSLVDATPPDTLRRYPVRQYRPRSRTTTSRS